MKNEEELLSSTACEHMALLRVLLDVIRARREQWCADGGSDESFSLIEIDVMTSLIVRSMLEIIHRKTGVQPNVDHMAWVLGEQFPPLLLRKLGILYGVQVEARVFKIDIDDRRKGDA